MSMHENTKQSNKVAIDDKSKWPVCQYTKCKKRYGFDKKKWKYPGWWMRSKCCCREHGRLAVVEKYLCTEKECLTCGKILTRKSGEGVKRFLSRKQCTTCVLKYGRGCFMGKQKSKIKRERRRLDPESGKVLGVATAFGKCIVPGFYTW